MADIFLDTSVEAVEASSKFTRRRTVGPRVQKQKNKVVFADFAGKFWNLPIFQSYPPEY